MSKWFLVTICATLAISTLACGVISAPLPAEEQPVQAAAPTEPPVSAPSGSSFNPNGIVPCAQLIPPDEITNLLNNTPATLSENAHSGGSICAWQYTPNGSAESHLFYLEANFGADAAALWEAKRRYELSQEPSDIVINSINGLGEESYVWASKATGFYVVFTRSGDKTLVMRFYPQEVLYMANESGILDMADRVFRRF